MPIRTSYPFVPALLALAVGACQSAPPTVTPDVDATVSAVVAATATARASVQATIDAAVAATIAAQPPTPTPTYTPTPSPTATPPPTPTPTATPTPWPSPTPTPPAATKPTSGLPTTFGAGTWIPGRNVEPGRYRNTPAGACRWRLEHRGGGLSGRIHQTHMLTIDIFEGDTLTVDSSCGTWSPAPTSGPRSTSFGAGRWIVGVDIAPGTYQSSGEGTCSWFRRADFQNAESWMALDYGESAVPVVVTILPSDTGFQADEGCGTWTLVEP